MKNNQAKEKLTIRLGRQLSVGRKVTWIGLGILFGFILINFYWLVIAKSVESIAFLMIAGYCAFCAFVLVLVYKKKKKLKSSK